MKFFEPSDITVHTCSVNNVTNGGSAFAVCKDGDSVFISPKIVASTNVEVGDMVTAHCIDNHRTEEGKLRYAVRWRAIRIDITQKLVPNNDFEDLLKQDRAWTAAQMARACNKSTLQASNWLQYEHVKGNIAAMSISKRADQ